MPALPVWWNRPVGDAWGELFSVDFDDPHFEGLEGVFMVWIGGSQPAAIAAGSGVIRDKLKERRADPQVQQLRDKTLLVTWAKVDAASRPGVERWLLDTLRPRVAQPAPNAAPIEVNLPGRPGLPGPDAGAPPRKLEPALAAAQAAAAPAAAPAATQAGATPEVRIVDLRPLDLRDGQAAPPAQAQAPYTTQQIPVARPPVTRSAPAQPEPTGSGLTRLPLQAQFLDIVKKSREPGKASGLFGGAAKPTPNDEKLVTDIVQMILRESVRLKASDIHIEPQETFTRVRLRLDGILDEAMQIPNGLNMRIVSQIRVACGLDPERGVGTSKPEDGRMSYSQDGMEADVRLSTFPTAYGDKAVMRVIPRGTKLVSIDELFSPRIADALRQQVMKTQGMFVVTGPTGSGKSTTLYAILQTLNQPSRNIVTLEDPIEKKLAGITQGLIQPKAGFGFAEGLRAILRQDPNVIMVGEIRDLETAEIAVAASLTGHMLFTTLHANSALGVITRLLDMGLEPFLIVSALTAVSAQRLARKVCQNCAQPTELSAAERADIEHRCTGLGIPVPEQLLRSLKKGNGCDACRNTGFSGRVLLFEFSPLTPTLRQLVLKKAPLDELIPAAMKDGMEPMFLDGLRKAGEGQTTIAEVCRVIEAGD